MERAYNYGKRAVIFGRMGRLFASTRELNVMLMDHIATDHCSSKNAMMTTRADDLKGCRIVLLMRRCTMSFRTRRWQRIVARWSPRQGSLAARVSTAVAWMWYQHRSRTVRWILLPVCRPEFGIPKSSRDVAWVSESEMRLLRNYCANDQTEC